MIVVLYGAGDYAIHRHIQQLKAQYSKKYTDALEMISCDASEMTMANLEQVLLATPMFFSHRLVIVRGLGSLKEQAAALQVLLGGLPDTTVAVLDCHDLDKRTSLYKALTKLPGAKEYKQLSAQELKRWLQQEAKRLGGSLGVVEAQALLDRAGPDQWRLANELDKLTASGVNIDRDMIIEQVSPTLNDSAFSLVEHVMQGNTAAALKLYDELLLTGSSEPALIGALQWQARVMSLILAEATPDEVSGSGVNPYALNRVRGLTQRLGQEGVAHLYNSLLRADVDLKQGKLKPQQVMTRLLLELSAR